MQLEAGRGVITPAAGMGCGGLSGALEFGDVAGEPTTAPAIAPADSPPVDVNAQQRISPEAVEVRPKFGFDQTAILTADAGDHQWMSPMDADADVEPVAELEFDQTLGW